MNDDLRGPDSADWWRSVAQGLGVKLHAAEEVIEAWRLFTIGQSSKVRPERIMEEYLSAPTNIEIACGGDLKEADKFSRQRIAVMRKRGGL